MNPDANFNLPPPVGASAPGMPVEAAPTPMQPEQALAARPEAAGTPSAPTVTQQAYTVNSQLLAALDAPAPAAVAATTQTASDDDDDIEKEWVQKAKQIVGQTGDNPFEQNRQLAHVKADYLQRRYGKVVKLAE